MGHTMIAIRPTTSFIMGAPLSEARRETNELPHKVYIPRAFAIASKEVSVAQFQRFLSETGRNEAWLKATRERWPNNPEPGKFTSNLRRAQFAVTWFRQRRPAWVARGHEGAQSVRTLRHVWKRVGVGE